DVSCHGHCNFTCGADYTCQTVACDGGPCAVSCASSNTCNKLTCSGDACTAVCSGMSTCGNVDCTGACACDVDCMMGTCSVDAALFQDGPRVVGDGPAGVRPDAHRTDLHVGGPAPREMESRDVACRRVAALAHLHQEVAEAVEDGAASVPLDALRDVRVVAD